MRRMVVHVDEWNMRRWVDLRVCFRSDFGGPLCDESDRSICEGYDRMLEAAITQLARHCSTCLLDTVCQDENGEHEKLLYCPSKRAAIKSPFPGTLFSVRSAFTVLDVDCEVENRLSTICQLKGLRDA
jgi:hypothetical protein